MTAPATAAQPDATPGAAATDAPAVAVVDGRPMFRSDLVRNVVAGVAVVSLGLLIVFALRDDKGRS